jgi:peptidoglycan hydrolase-like protein with peptidoglycan-binding domain
MADDAGMPRAHDVRADPAAGRLTPPARPPEPAEHHGPPEHRSAPERLLDIQRSAGNAAAAALVLRQAVAPPAPAPVTVRPTLRRGDLDRMVGVAQQKLNVLGARPELRIDGEFGPATQAAVNRFQRSRGLSGGVLDTSTWSALDSSVSGGDVAPDGSLTPVRGTAPGDSSSPALPDTDVHPVLRLGATGPAVAELREKLGLAVTPGLAGADAAVFDAATDAAVRAFQRAHPPLGVDGIAGRRTWARLDAVAPGAGAGQVSRFGVQHARGGNQGGPIEADWALEPDRTAPTRLHVRVRYNFTNNPARSVNQPAEVARIFAGIRSIWNQFKATEVPLPGAAPRPDVLIDFQPEEGTPTRHNVVLTAGVGPTNASEYFIEPTSDIVGIAAHEFGHHIGLQDEYQQSAADHLRQTGEAAPVGEVTGDAPARDIALELGRAVRTLPRANRGALALGVVRSHSLVQGAFAQQVALRYRQIWGIDVVADCNERIDQRPDEGSLTEQRQTTHPFLYNADNLMGGAESQGSPHEHDVSPRHVREYVGIVERAVGGVWEPAQR